MGNGKFYEKDNLKRETEINNANEEKMKSRKRKKNKKAK